MDWELGYEDSGILKYRGQTVAYFDDEQFNDLMTELVKTLNTCPPLSLVHYLGLSLAGAMGALSVRVVDSEIVDVEPPSVVSDGMRRYLEWLEEG